MASNITANTRRLVLWQQARGLPCQGPIVRIAETDLTHSILKRLSSERVARRLQALAQKENTHVLID